MNSQACSSILLKEAPALHSALKRILGKEALQEAESIYEKAIRLGANQDGTKRLKEASYNPRPARITAILLREYSQCGPHLAVFSLHASSLATTQPSTLLFQLESLLQELSGKFKIEDIGRQDLLAVALALEIDHIRHLHMSDRPFNSCKERARLAKLIIQEAKEHNTLQRLSSILIRAIERYEGSQNFSNS